MPPNDAYARLAETMNQRRIALGLQWTDVADMAKITTSHLRKYRNGEAGISGLVAARLEQALKWESGSLQRILDDEQPIETAAVSTPASVTHAANEGSREWLMAAVREFSKRLPRSDVRALLEEYSPLPEVPEGSHAFVNLADPVERQIWRIEELPVMWREQLIGVLRQMRLIDQDEAGADPQDPPGEVTELRNRS